MLSDCYVQQVSTLCALGNGKEAIAQALFSSGKSPLVPNSSYQDAGAAYIGSVDLPDDQQPLALEHRSRNNYLLRQAVSTLADDIEQLKSRFGPQRIGVVLGTSTSGIWEGEAATIHYHAQQSFPAGFHYRQQEIGAPSLFLAEHLGLTGPAWTISTACTSGAKALASARRLLKTGICDAVVAGGVDSLCRLTVRGFSALGAVSSSVSRPFSAGRDGINIGEGAAIFILSKDKSQIRISGCGETSDAHHISAPDPTGLGAEAAMRQALSQAKMQPSDIDYINLHGTGTEQNDVMESAAVYRVFGGSVNCNSTKPLTGHTLGAAGAIEAAFCCYALDANRLPLQPGEGPRGDDIAPLERLFEHKPAKQLTNAMSNSFAFGGSNMSIIMSKAAS